MNLDAQVLANGLSFALGLFVLVFFDISLPRGDNLGVSGALVAAGLVLLGPGPIIAASLLGTIVATLARSGGRDFSALPRALVHVSTCVAAATAVALALRGAGLTPSAVAAASIGAYLIAELLVSVGFARLGTERSLGRLLRGGILLHFPSLLAQLSSALLLTVVYSAMGNWSVLVVVLLLMLIRQSYALLLGIRETYRTTVAVLVQAAEGAEGQSSGHAERTARFARQMGELCGLSSTEVDRLSYAALLHDLKAIAGGELGESSGILAGVGLFQDVRRVLLVYEGCPPEDASEPELLSGYLVALANDIEQRSNAEAPPSTEPPSVRALGSVVPRRLKARAVSAALELGMSVPAVE